MPSVLATRPQPDCIVLEVLPQWKKALLWAAPVVLWCVVELSWKTSEARTLAWLLLGAVLVPVCLLQVRRAMRGRHHSLVRTQGRLLLDGEPLELARVELKVKHRLLAKIPKGYDLTLWVMTPSGPEDVPLGSYRTLLEASRVSGDFDEFVGRPSPNREPRHV